MSLGKKERGSMPGQKLRKAPLIEAIVEVRWQPKVPDESGYMLMLGRMAEAFLHNGYPARQSLPHADMPPAFAAQMHMVQHQFRVSEGGWPLVQIGPTVFTLNETEAYDWEGDFRGRAIEAVETLFKVLGGPDQVRIESLLLRYIDGIDFDWEKASLLEFLETNLKTRIAFPPALFDNTGVNPTPAGLDFTSSFRCMSPAGIVHLRLASGQSKGKTALVMETMVQSLDADVPSLPTGFADWLDAAHEVPSRWFRLLTQGELYRRFQGD